MDETLTPVNDGQASDEGLQQVESTEQTVNADSAEVTTGSQEQTTTETATEAKSQSKEENAQFAKVRREAEARVKAEFEAKQAARDAEFAKMADAEGWKDSNGNPIKTEEAYWREVKYQREIDKLVTGGKDPETAKLKIEYERLKEEREAERNAKAEEARKQAENQAFFDFYREANGKEFTTADEIPEEVFRNAQENNVPLKYAYAEYLAKAAREKEKNISLGKQAAEVNAKNAESSTGSVTGTPTQDAITMADIEAHSNDRAWVRSNWNSIQKLINRKDDN